MNGECKCSECTVGEACPVYDILRLSKTKSLPDALKKMEEMRKTVENTDPKIKNAMNFWIDSLIESQDKEDLEFSVEAIKQLTGTENYMTLVDDIKLIMPTIYEKCKRLQVTGF